MYYPAFERVLALSSTPAYESELLDARNEFFALIGKFHEDEPLYEAVTLMFHEWYLFDRAATSLGHPPVYEVLSGATMPPEQATEVAQWNQTHASIFEVRVIGVGLRSRGGLKLRDCFTRKDYDVYERREIAGLETGDIVQTRIFPYGSVLVCSNALVVHPRAIRRNLLKVLAKAAAQGDDAMRRAMRMLLYCRITLDRMHDKVDAAAVYAHVLDGTFAPRGAAA